MEFFDQLPAVAFYTLYGTLVAVAISVTAAVWQVAKRDSHPELPLSDWDAYDVAFLAGGPERVTEAALARLVSGGVLKLQVTEYRAVIAMPLPTDAHPVELAVYAAIQASDADGTYLPSFGVQVRDLIRKRALRLKEQGLYVSSRGVRITAAVSVLVWAVPGLLALLRCAVRSREYPGNTDPTNETQGLWIAFALHLVACLWAVGVFNSTEEQGWVRGRRGDRLLAEVREQLAAWCSPTYGPSPELAGMQLVACVGLYGLGRWRVGPLAELLVTLAGPPSSE